MNVQIDLEKLIRMVEERPLLWDRTIEGYRNPRLSKAAWQEIYSEIIENYYLMDEQTKFEAGKFVTSKWTQARDVWQKSLKKRRELNEQEPQPGSREAVRHERMKFLLKVYSNKEDHEHNEFPSFFVDSVDSEGETLPNFRFTTPVEKPSETITSQSREVNTQSHNLNLPRKKLSKSDYTIRHNSRVKKNHQLKKDKYGRHGNRINSHNPRITVKNIYSLKETRPKVEHSSNRPKTETIEMQFDNNEEPMASTSFETQPVIKQEDQPSSSNCNEENTSCGNKYTPPKQPLEETLDFDELSAYLNSLKPRLQSFNEIQFLDFQVGVIQLLKKIKYPDRG